MCTNAHVYLYICAVVPGIVYVYFAVIFHHKWSFTRGIDFPSKSIGGRQLPSHHSRHKYNYHLVQDGSRGLYNNLCGLGRTIRDIAKSVIGSIMEGNRDISIARKMKE